MGKADYNDRLKDYVQVNERVMKFYEKYPEGSIQSEMIYRDDKLVVFKAFAYRDRDDSKPGVGHSSLEIPGATPYTEGSEVENAETSAWGRALAALGFEVKRGIASRNEIENKHKPDNGNGNQNEALRLARIALRKKAAKTLGSEDEGDGWLREEFRILGVTSGSIQLMQIMELSERLSNFTPPDEDTQQPDDSDIEF